MAAAVRPALAAGLARGRGTLVNCDADGREERGTQASLGRAACGGGSLEWAYDVTKGFVGNREVESSFQQRGIPEA